MQRRGFEQYFSEQPDKRRESRVQLEYILGFDVKDIKRERLLDCQQMLARDF